MAETTDKNDSVATEAALQEVAALKSRIGHQDATLEETNRRLTATANELAQTRDVAERATAAIEAVTTGAKTDTELETANREMGDLERQYEEAFTAGDGKQVAALQRKMAMVGGKISQLSTAREEPKPRVADDGTSGRVRQPPTPEQQREAFIQSRTPKTAAWLRQHPEYFTDQKVGAKIRAADLDWEADGKPKDTPEYFEHIERRAGLIPDPATTAREEGGGKAANGKAPDKQTGTEGTARDLAPAGGDMLPEGKRGPPQAGRGRTTPVAAPPSRDGSMPGRRADGEKRITPEMQRWAAMMYPNGGITPEEYFDEYVRLKEAGEIIDRF